MSEHVCAVCARGKMHRSERRGLWERYVLAFFGQYPWRCGFCRNRVMLPDRGPQRHYVRSHRAKPEKHEV